MDLGLPTNELVRIMRECAEKDGQGTELTAQELAALAMHFAQYVSSVTGVEPIHTFPVALSCLEGGMILAAAGFTLRDEKPEQKLKLDTDEWGTLKVMDA